MSVPSSTVGTGSWSDVKGRSRPMAVHPLSVTAGQALAWRMRRQLLEPVGTAPAEDVVRRLTAVPAQSDVELDVRTRQQTSRAGEVADALADGRIIRTFSFRG